MVNPRAQTLQGKPVAKPGTPLLMNPNLVCKSDKKGGPLYNIQSVVPKRMSVGRNIHGRWMNVEIVSQIVIILDT